MAEQRYLFQISIGPVQEFIASARRTRDLWYGSWLLSELSRAAAKAIQDATKNQDEGLIFPAPVMLEQPNGDDIIEPASIANKIVASIETDDIAAFGEAIAAAVLTQLRELREQAFKYVEWTDAKLGDADRALAEQQVEDMLRMLLGCGAIFMKTNTNRYASNLSK